MIPYFYDADEKEKLLSILSEWHGTPYMHMGTGKGGVDCSKFIGLVLVELGVLSQIEPRGYYSQDWYNSAKNGEVVLLSIINHAVKYMPKNYSLEGNKIFTPDEYTPQFGDILTFSTCSSGLSNHMGIALDNGFFCHCLNRIGVIKTQLYPVWEKKLTYFYRLYINEELK